jgi:hypothetical protein
MEDLGILLEKIHEVHDTAAPTEVERLPRKAKCSKCYYSALCLATSFEEVVERLKLFVCPECKNLFATFLEKGEIVIREVPLPSCAAFMFATQRHVCSEVCRTAQIRTNSYPPPLGQIIPEIPITPIPPVGTGTISPDGWYTYTSDNTLPPLTTKIECVAGDRPNANGDSFEATKRALDNFIKQSNEQNK